MNQQEEKDPGGCFWLFAIVFLVLFCLERCTPKRYPWNGRKQMGDQVQYSKED